MLLFPTQTYAEWSHSVTWDLDADFLNNAVTTGDASNKNGTDVSGDSVFLAKNLLDKVSTFDAGTYHSAAITTDGKVYTTGEGDDYRLASGSTADVYSWSDVTNENITDPVYISAGDKQTFVANSSGIPAFTGYNSYGLSGGIEGGLWLE